MALREIQRQGKCRVTELVTTVTDAYDRVSMHGVRRELLRRQAESLGLPVTEVVVPPAIVQCHLRTGNGDGIRENPR